MTARVSRGMKPNAIAVLTQIHGTKIDVEEEKVRAIEELEQP